MSSGVEVSDGILISSIVGDDVYRQLEELRSKIAGVGTEVLALAGNLEKIEKALGAAKILKELAKAQDDLAKAQKKVNDQEKETEKLRKRQTALEQKQEATEKALTEALNQQAKSIKEAREQNKLLTKARNEINVTTKEGVERLNQLNAKIDANNRLIKQNGDAALKQKMNIGNYKSSLEGLDSILESVGGRFGPAISGAVKLTKSLGPLGAVLGVVVGLFKAAAGEIKLWTTTTARGEEAARRFRMELDIIKENRKNNAGFNLDNITSETNLILQTATSGAEAIAELDKKKKKSFRDILTMMFLGAAAEEGALDSMKDRAKSELTLEAQLLAAIKETSLAEEEYQRRVKQYSKDSYDYDRANIDNLTKVAELERDIARLKETTKDETKSEAEKQAALNALLVKTNELEAIETKMAGEKVRLIQEESELTHTAQYDTLHAIDKLLKGRQEELELLKQAEADGKTRVEVEGKSVDIAGRRAALEADINQLMAWRQEADGDILANDEKRVQAAVGLMAVQEKYASQRRSLAEEGKALSAASENERKQALKDYTDTYKKELAAQVAAAKAKADELKGVYDANESGGLTRVDDLAAWLDARKEYLRLAEEAEIKLERDTAAKRIELLGLTGEEAAKVTEQAEANVNAIKVRYAAEGEKEAAEASRLTRKAVFDQMRAEVADLTASVDEEENMQLYNLRQRLDAGELTYKQYVKAVNKIEVDAAKARYEAQLAYVDRLLKAEGVSDSERRSALAQLKKDYDEFRNTVEGAGESASAEDWANFFDRLKEMAGDAWNVIANAVSTSIQNQLTDLEKLKNKEQADYEKRLERVRNAGLSQRQQELETARIEREHAAEQEKLAEQEAQLKRKQAIWDKANNLIQATIRTALAVTNALGSMPPPANFAMAAVVGALGAAEIATIAAQKIPEYRTGRAGGGEELAIVGDGGVSEVIETPAGEAVVTPAKPTLVHLGRGDRVYRDVEQYLLSRSGDERAAGELRALRKERRESDEQLITAMNNMNARLAVTSAGLAWLRGGREAGNGRG